MITHWATKLLHGIYIVDWKNGSETVRELARFKAVGYSPLNFAVK